MNGHACINVFSLPVLSNVFGDISAGVALLLWRRVEYREKLKQRAVVSRRRIDIDYHWETLINEHEFERHFHRLKHYYARLVHIYM